MKGTITIKVTENGYGIDTDLEEISFQDKVECMHSLSVVLEMDEHEMLMYFIAERSGVLKDAGNITHCESTEELEQRLQGGIASES